MASRRGPRSKKRSQPKRKGHAGGGRSRKKIEKGKKPGGRKKTRGGRRGAKWERTSSKGGGGTGRRQQTGRRSEGAKNVEAELLRGVGSIRREGRALWIEPYVLGPAVFVQDESAKSLADGAVVRYRIVTPSSHSSAAVGTVVESIGHGKLPQTILKLALLQAPWPHEFSSQAIKQAQRFEAVDAKKVLQPGKVSRADLRGIEHVTIDGEDAKDFDDAIAVADEGDGIRVWVSIADVASYVKEDSPLDRDAHLRATSVYLPGTVFPMLPEALSNDLCSLRPHEPRLTLTCEFVVNRRGIRKVVGVYPSLIESAHRLTYTQVQTFFDKGEGVPVGVEALLNNALQASERLRSKRVADGGLEIDLPEFRAELDADGAPVKVNKRDQTRAHKLIEDLMIGANESVAEFLVQHKIAGIYRIHPPPTAEKWEALAQWGKPHGLKLPKQPDPQPATLARFAKDLRRTEVAFPGQMLLLRTLSQAMYRARRSIHYGLASKAYVHFTSPIRRYPDLVVHRALWQHFQGENTRRPLKDIADHCSDQERKAMELERSINQLAGCLVAERQVGAEFDALVVGIHPAGAFVRPSGLWVEGLVPVERLGGRRGEFFEVFADKHVIVGRSTGARLVLGDTIRVKLARVDLTTRRVNFDLACDLAALSKQVSKPSPRKGRRRSKDERPSGRGKKSRGRGKKDRGTR